MLKSWSDYYWRFDCRKKIVCNKVRTAVKNKGKKPDALIVNSSKKVVAYIECKKPDEFDTDKKVQAAIKQEIDVAKELFL